MDAEVKLVTWLFGISLIVGIPCCTYYNVRSDEMQYNLKAICMQVSSPVVHLDGTTGSTIECDKIGK